MTNDETMIHHFKCRDCGTVTETDNPGVKVCRKCKLNHDGPTDEEAAAKAESLAAKVDPDEGEEKAKVTSSRKPK